MTSTNTMIFLMAIYAVIAAQSAYERNWYRALYFVAAILISIAVLGMKGK